MIIGSVRVIFIMLKFFCDRLWHSFSFSLSHPVLRVLFVWNKNFVTQNSYRRDKHKNLDQKRFVFEMFINRSAGRRFVREKQDRLKKTGHTEHQDQRKHAMIVNPLTWTAKFCVKIFFILLLWLNVLISSAVFPHQGHNVNSDTDEHWNERKIYVEQKELFHLNRRKLRSSDSCWVFFDFFDVAVKQSCILVPRRRISNHIQRIQSACGRWTSHHSGKVNALD